MHALVLRDHRLVFEERPTPVPDSNDVVVEVRAAGINAADLLQRRGFYPAPPGWPTDIPGLEMAGVVTDVGSEVNHSVLGSRVCAVVGGGAHATHCRVPVEHLLPVPLSVSWPEAGGFGEAFTTAYDALIITGSLREGERVLVSGAAGGVGVAAVQIAHHHGAHVIAVTRDRVHHDELHALGADETITMDHVEGIQGVDVVLELIGAAHLTMAMGKLNPRARVIVIGVGGGGRIEVDLLAIMANRAILTGSTLRARSRDEKGALARRVADALESPWAARTLQVPLAREFSLRDGDEAYDYFAQPGKFGKVVFVL